MKKIAVTMIIMAITTLLATGCSAGKDFSFHDAKTVKVGDSSEVLIEKMGSRPHQITAVQDGNNESMESFIWVYVDGVTFARKSVSFPVKNNRVLAVPHISDAILNQ